MFTFYPVKSISQSK